MSYLKIVIVTIVLCLETVILAPRKPRLTLAEPMPSYYHTDIGGEPGAYSFGYDVWDPATGNTQFRSEERYPNGTVAGSYGYVDPLGESRTYKYIADERGYRLPKVVGATPGYVGLSATKTHSVINATWNEHIASKFKKAVMSQINNGYQNVDDTVNAEASPTESSKTWTRASKKKTKQDKGNSAFLRRKYNDVQPPGYYLLY